MVRDQRRRCVRQVAVKAIVIGIKAGNDADSVADLETADPIPDGGNRSRSFIARTSRKPGSRYISARSKHHLCAVQSQRVDADLDFALCWRKNFDLFDLQNFRATDLMKSHYFCHV